MSISQDLIFALFSEMFPFLKLRYIFRIIHILKQPILNPMLRVVEMRRLCLGREMSGGVPRVPSLVESVDDQSAHHL